MITPFFALFQGFLGGGVETHLKDLCNYLSKKDFKVIVITYRWMEKRVGPCIEKRKNVDIYRMPWFSYHLFSGLRRFPLLQFFYTSSGLFLYSIFFVLIYQKEVDVIHAHGLNAAFVANLLARLFNKRTVVSTHAIYGFQRSRQMAKLVRLILSTIDIVMALTQASKSDLMEMGIKGNRMQVYHHWVDINEFRVLNRMECKRHFGLDNRLLVLYVGRLVREKGVQLLLDVSSKVDPEQVFFVFVGNGELAKQIKEKTNNQSNLKFLRDISKRELVKCYNAADIFVIPSIHEEAFGRVVLEALACGTPVVAANKGGLRYIIDPSIGFLVDPTVENIYRIINYVCENRTMLPERMYCREFVEKHFSEENAEKIVNVYNSLITQKVKAPAESIDMRLN